MNSPRLSASLRREYDALTAGAGWSELGVRTQIEVTGEDRARLLHNLCTADINRLQPGGGCEAFFTTVQGKTLALVQIFCGQGALVVETAAGQAELLMAHLDRYLIREEVHLHDRSQSWVQFLLSGAQVECRLGDLQLQMPQQPQAHADVRLGDASVSLRRVCMTGQHSFCISVDANQSETVKRAIDDAGVTRCGPEAVEVVRVESGWPIFGQDVTDQNLPQEVGRDDQAISFTKGCYLGQETVARIDAVGHVNRKLVGVGFTSETIPDTGASLISDDQEVGRVTSSVFSPLLDSPLALAYVRRGHDTPGTRLKSELGDAEVVPLPVQRRT